MKKIILSLLVLGTLISNIHAMENETEPNSIDKKRLNIVRDNGSFNYTIFCKSADTITYIKESIDNWIEGIKLDSIDMLRDGELRIYGKSYDSVKQNWIHVNGNESCSFSQSAKASE